MRHERNICPACRSRVVTSPHPVELHFHGDWRLRVGRRDHGRRPDCHERGRRRHSFQPPAAGTNQAIRLPDVIVTGRTACSVSPVPPRKAPPGRRNWLTGRHCAAGEILETVPGVIITQHAGSGKANQYFLRGFNLDHGTDFAVFLDDMPLNLPSHAHGEGYSDMNNGHPGVRGAGGLREGAVHTPHPGKRDLHCYACCQWLSRASLTSRCDS